jgi:hypothetical protein
MMDDTICVLGDGVSVLARRFSKGPGEIKVLRGLVKVNVASYRFASGRRTVFPVLKCPCICSLLWFCQILMLKCIVFD